MSFSFHDDWKVSPASDYCERVADGTHESPKFLTVGHPLVTSRNLKRWGIDLSDANLISEQDFLEINKRSKVHQWDVIFTMIGTVGEVYLVKEKEPAYAIKNVGLFKCNGDEVSASWLYYYLSSPQIRHLIHSRKKGTTQQYVSLGELRKLPIYEPDSLLEKQAITELLRSLDDRITLLRATNTTLEAIAQALFKSWFVDFDPVHAKQQGREPEGMDAATAALFPDSFEESELGLVPSGWTGKPIGKAFILTMGQSPPGDTYNSLGDGLPFFQGRTDFGFRFPTQRIFCNAPTRLADIGDTLVSVRAPVGDVNMALEKCCIGRGVAGVKHPLGYRSFVFYSLRELKSKFDQFDSEGTVFGSINKKDFEALTVIEPNENILKKFDDIAAPLDDKIVENENQLRSLTLIRDTLLPRLISGQLRLPEAEALIAETEETVRVA